MCLSFDMDLCCTNRFVFDNWHLESRLDTRTNISSPNNHNRCHCLSTVCSSRLVVESRNQHPCNRLDSCNNSHHWPLMSNCLFCMDYFRKLVLVDHSRLLWSQVDKHIHSWVYLEEVDIDCHEHKRCSCTRLLEFHNNYQCMLASMNKHMCLFFFN